MSAIDFWTVLACAVVSVTVSVTLVVTVLTADS